jgi:hypothetical protein
MIIPRHFNNYCCLFSLLIRCQLKHLLLPINLILHILTGQILLCVAVVKTCPLEVISLIVALRVLVDSHFVIELILLIIVERFLPLRLLLKS